FPSKSLQARRPRDTVEISRLDRGAQRARCCMRHSRVGALEGTLQPPWRMRPRSNFKERRANSLGFSLKNDLRFEGLRSRKYRDFFPKHSSLLQRDGSE